MEKKAKTSRKKNNILKLLFGPIIIVILILVVILCYIGNNKPHIELEKDSEAIPGIEDKVEEKQDTMTEEITANSVEVKNERLGEDEAYNFELKNTGSITQDCWVTIQITVDSTVIFSEEQYVGHIESGQAIPISKKLDIPDGESLIGARPNCTAVNE